MRVTIPNLFPRFSNIGESYLYYTFMSIAVVGIMPFFAMKNGTASGLFDLLMFISLIGVLFMGISRSALPLFSIASSLLILNFLIFVYKYDFEAGAFSVGEVKNFIYSNKFLYYSTIVLFFVRKRIFTPRFFERITGILLSAAALKYTYMRLLGIDDRPKLLLENNYEVMMFMILFTVMAINRRRSQGVAPAIYLCLLTYVIILSGSRSAILAFVPLFSILYYRKTYGGTITAVWGVIAVVAVAFAIFMSRGDSLEDIDRYRFLLLFFTEIESFNVINYLFGTSPLTPLSPSTCSSLSYYKALFSSAGDGRCYAIIFHSLFMRVFFDHGVVILIFSFYAMWRCLHLSGYSRLESLALMSMPIASALSVSSIGTAFVSFPLALALAAKLEVPNRSIL